MRNDSQVIAHFIFYFFFVSTTEALHNPALMLKLQFFFFFFFSLLSDHYLVYRYGSKAYVPANFATFLDHREKNVTLTLAFIVMEKMEI